MPWRLKKRDRLLTPIRRPRSASWGCTSRRNNPGCASSICRIRSASERRVGPSRSRLLNRRARQSWLGWLCVAWKQVTGCSRAAADVESTSRRDYSWLIDRWGTLIGLHPSAFGTHSLRRTKVALVCQHTGSIRVCQLLLGHTKLENTSVIWASKSMTRRSSRSRPRFKMGATAELAAACRYERLPSKGAE